MPTAAATPVIVLTPNNATRWFLDKKGHLGKKRVGYVIDDDAHAPGLSTPPTTEELKLRREWKSDNDAACAIIWEDLTDEQKSKDNVCAAYENRDARGMWKALQRIARPANVSSRYMILVELIRLSMRTTETLEAYLNRVRAVAAEWRTLWPQGFSLDQVLAELALGAFLNGLSVERQPWSSTVLAQLKQHATLDALENFARLEDSNQAMHGNPAARAMAVRVAPFSSAPSGSAPVLALPTPTVGRRITREEALGALHKALGLKDCFVCAGKHSTDKCSLIDIAIQAATDARKARNLEKRIAQGDKRTANAAQASITEVSEASVRHFVYSTLASLAARRSAESDWNTDTGCSTHMTPHRDWFVTYSPLRVPIELADHSLVYSAGVGSVEFRPSLDGREQPYTIILDSVLHVPSLAVNLLSVYTLTTKRGYTMNAHGYSVRFSAGGRLRMTATVTDQMTGYLNGRTVQAPRPIPRALLAVAPKRVPLTPDLWHRRFGHLDPSTLRRMHARESVVGLKFERTPPDILCEPCLHGKQKRDAISRAVRPRVAEPLGEVHWDLKGPLPRSPTGFLYWAIGVDSATRFKSINFLKRKSDFHDSLVGFIAGAENQTGRRYKTHWHDKGGEFISKRSIDFCRERGIEIRETETASPWQNGLAERANGVVRDHVVSMLREACLPASWWPFAASCFIYAYNRSPSGDLDSTPFELWYGVKPDVSLMRVFGCLAYALRWRERQDGALGSHTRKSIFVGYSSARVGCWLFYDLDSRDTFECSTAVFVEDCFPGLGAFSKDLPDYDELFALDEPAADIPTQVNDDADEEDLDEPVTPVPAPARQPAPVSVPDVAATPSPPVQRAPSPLEGTEPSRLSSPAQTAPAPAPVPLLPTFPLPTTPNVPTRSELVHRTEHPPAPVFYNEARVNARALPKRSARPTHSLAEPGGRGMGNYPVAPALWERKATMPEATAGGTEALPATLSALPDSEPEALRALPALPEVVSAPPLDFIAQDTTADRYTAFGVRIGGSADPDVAHAASAHSPPLVTVSDASPENVWGGYHAAHLPEPEHVMLDGVADLAEGYLTLDEASECAFALLVRVCAFSTTAADYREPRSYKEAMRREGGEAEHWRAACREELNNLVRKGVYQIVKLPPGRTPIGSIWVFKAKRGPTGDIERYKARLTADGRRQREGVDYKETFAPTIRWGSLRTILARVALEGWVCLSADITAAYLNGSLDEEVYMRRPEGFNVPMAPDEVLKLLMSLYGLKQAGRNWHRKLHEVLTELHFDRIVVEHCVWVYRRGDVHVIVPVYVDDLNVAAPTEAQAQGVLDELKKHLELRKLGPTRWLLGVEIRRDESKRAIGLSQKQYALDILDSAGFLQCAPVATPMEPGFQKARLAHATETTGVDQQRYARIVGQLMYLVVATRPDLAFTVGVLARHTKNPCSHDVKALHHALRYVRATAGHMLIYAPDVRAALPHNDYFQTFSDADFAGCPETGRSTSGMVVKVGTGATHWASKLQTLVTTSSTEAEYVAACAAGQEVVFNQHFYEGLGFPSHIPSKLWLDNKSALQVARNPEHHGRMKHLDVKYFWLREQVDAGRIAVDYCPTADMPADVLTKALPAHAMEKARRLLGVLDGFDALV